MGIVSAIYKAPVVATATSELMGEVFLLMEYEGRLYEGQAKVSPEDKEFFSERVGVNIAKSRAYLEIFRATIAEARYAAETKQRMKKELINTSGYSWSELDPTGNIQKSIDKSEEKVGVLVRAYKREKAKLNAYLNDQAKMIESVLRYRKENESKQAEDN